MNCFGTNPRYTQSVQPVNNMNTMNSFPTSQNNMQAMQPAAMQPATVTAQNPYNTTTSGEWSQPIPVNPNMATSPASVWPSVPATDLPPTLTSPIYTPGYLMQHIGDLMRVEFLIGNATTDRVGRLKQVGASFIVLSALDGGSEIVCDIYSIKFVTLIQNNVEAQLLGSF